MHIPHALYDRITVALRSVKGASDETLPDELPEEVHGILRGTVPIRVRALYLLILEFEAEEGELEQFDDMAATAYSCAYHALHNMLVLAILYLLHQRDVPSFTVTRGWKLYELERIPKIGEDDESPPKTPAGRPKLTLIHSK